MSYFVAVDGEGYTDPDTDIHYYNMMGSSLGSHVVDHNGLRTIDCLRFLLDTKEAAGKGSVLVAFAFSYDVNMMLKDVGKVKLVELWTTGETRWRDYKLEWLPSKSFYIRDVRRKRSVKVYDTFGFFQCSFAKALAGWNVEAPEQLDHMKQSRSRFTPEREAEIIEYCLSECRSLVELMDMLKASLDSVNLPTSSWHGAGAIAAALLRRERVGEHVTPDDEWPEDVRTPIMHAYFGGRTELFQQGEFDTLYGYDIRSAYPAATRKLPSLRGAKFTRVEDHYPTDDVISLHHVRWNTDPRATVQPFPFRNRRQILYPYQGEGWYWSNEVAAALELHPTGIDLIDAWVLEPATDARPFAFIDPIYEERARLKREGHFGHQSYKLAINALYGKLAQGMGHKGRTPPYRSYVWAGYITAATRAAMLRVACEDVAMICTDGIYFTSPQPIIESDELGGWEASLVTDAFIAQPGIYEGRGEKGEVKRSRGVFAKEVDFDDLREGYRELGPYYISRLKTTRFKGLGTAMVERSFRTWRRWCTSERKISLYPSRKYLEDDEARPVRHSAPSGLPGIISTAYDPKRSGMDAPGMVDFIQALEQPMREEV